MGLEGCPGQIGLGAFYWRFHPSLVNGFTRATRQLHPRDFGENVRSNCLPEVACGNKNEFTSAEKNHVSSDLSGGREPVGSHGLRVLCGESSITLFRTERLLQHDPAFTHVFPRNVPVRRHSNIYVARVCF